MADIYGAYQFLSDSLNLNLTPEEINSQEQIYKKKWLETNGYEVRDVDVDKWEFIGSVRPRGGKKKKSNDYE
jgi:hypothetical protein